MKKVLGVLVCFLLVFVAFSVFAEGVDLDQPIFVRSGCPNTCVVGEGFMPYCEWWNSVGETHWTMNVYLNGNLIVSLNEETGTYQIELNEEGICTVEIIITDSVGRVAKQTDTVRVISPEPLKINSFFVSKVKEIGPNSHDAYTTLDYTGGMHSIVSAKYQIYAKNAKGQWFMTWEDDYYTLKETYFWLGEDGYHFFRVILTDGVDTIQADTDAFLVGTEPVLDGLEIDDDGIWRYYENGTFVEKTGIVEFQGGQFFVANGVLCSDANGLAEYGGQWYFLSSGQIQTQYTGLALYDGEWFYINQGLLNTSTNGLVDYDGSKFIVAVGRIVRGVDGLWQNTDGVWYYLADGQVVTHYTGLALYDGAWFYVIDGRLATEFTGDVEYDGAIFHVVGGQVVEEAVSLQTSAAPQEQEAPVSNEAVPETEETAETQTIEEPVVVEEMVNEPAAQELSVEEPSVEEAPEAQEEPVA